MKINGLLQPEDIVPELSAVTKEGVLQELAAKVAERHAGLDREELLKILLERERLGSTGIGDGIAIPHGKLKRLAKPLLAFGRSLKGVDFDALKMLARISRILKDPDVRQALLEAPSAAAIFETIREQDSRY